MSEFLDRPTRDGGWRPLFLREMRDEIERTGFEDATHRLLQRNGVQVDVGNDIERLMDHNGGILLVGDHKHHWEFVAAIDLVNRIGRTDMLNIAKFYVGRQIEYMLGSVAASHVAPVYPRHLASDSKKHLSYMLIHRAAFRRSLLTLDESAQVNAQTLQSVSNVLVAGGVANIFPCGGIFDSIRAPWRRGVGTIIENIPEKDASEVLIVPYRVDNIHKARFMASTICRGKGLAGRPQRMDLQFGRLSTVRELVDGLEPSQQVDHSVQITAELRRQFIEHFRGTDE